jgi:hypothetical protein
MFFSEVQLPKQFVNAFIGFGFVPFQQLRHYGNIFGNGIMRKQPVILQHVANARRSNSGFSSRMFLPLMEIVPLSGSISRFSIFRVVVLPQPLVPSKARVSPSATSKDMPPTAFVAAECFYEALYFYHSGLVNPPKS